MSQKVVIERVSIKGAAPFLGLSDNADLDSERIYSRRPTEVMDWLCAAWRTRFNIHRSRRSRYDENHQLVPIGGSVDQRTVKESRLTQSWVAAVPELVIASPEKLEKQDWFAAVKRRRTLRAQGQDPGAMPRFRSAKKHDQIFCCWFNNGRNARFTQVNRRHGIVHITGQNPARWRSGPESQRFVIRIHVRTSEPIREYSSVRVNWTRRELVFVNDPLPVPRRPTGAVVGVDRGVAHQLATSDGEVMDLPKLALKKLDRKIRRLQRAQARAVNLTGKSVKDYLRAGPSKRYLARRAHIASLKARASRVVVDHQQKWTTELVRDHDVIVTENLSVKSMTSKAHAKPDPLRPGRFLPNGQAAKRGLNRVMQGAALGRLQQMLVYKCERAGVELIEVPAPYTSQRCNHCGHTQRENRKSQAVFHCRGCDHRANADINAACNILEDGLKARPGLQQALSNSRRVGHTCAWRESKTSVAGKPATGAVPVKREPQMTH